MVGGTLWLRVWIWTKVGLAALVALYLLVFVIKNNDHTARFWYWIGQEPETSILVLVSFAFLAGVIVALLVRTIIKTLRQIRDSRERTRTQRLERQVHDMQAKAAKLHTRPAAADQPVPPAPPAAPPV
jgi:uncharacterized membrane protein YciS (DUF1049 family)